MKKCKAVIFDMDGTILDTVDDLTASVNHAMGACGHRHDFTPEDGKRMFGSGVHTALQRALAMEAGLTEDSQLLQFGTPAMMTVPGIEEDEVARLEEVFRPYYLAHSADHTGPYRGIPELLRTLRARNLWTAVVSNKQDAAVQKLAAGCFAGLLDAAAGEKEQDGIRRKPAPDMVLSVLHQFGISPLDALYIGDSEIDIVTAQNAGMDCVSVTWGFRSRAYLESLRPFAIIDEPGQLLDLLL